MSANRHEKSLHFTAGPDEEGRRLDRVLADLYPDTPRARFKDWIEGGRATVGGQKRKPGYKIRSGDEVRLDLPDPEKIAIEPEDIPLAVLFEDPDLIVIDKQAGLTVHPAPHQPSGTLVNALMGMGVELSGYNRDRFRPGIVHRLDRGTSGVMVVAKTSFSHAALSRQFQRRTVTKEYRALALGGPEFEEGEIDFPVGRDRRNPLKMAVRQDIGRHAFSRYRVLERFPGACHLAVEIGTGRTHQIRVHLSALGHPVVADPLYGGGPAEWPASRLLREIGDEPEPAVLARPALHSFRLTFNHPVLGERMVFTAPLHRDMETALKILKRGI